MGFDWSDGNRKRPPNYLSRTMQKRLLAMTVMLLFLSLAMKHARRPETWHWLWHATGSKLPQDSATPVLDPVYSLPPEGHTGPNTPINTSGLHPQLDANLLANITDDTYFHRDEHSAWFHMLGLLKNSSQDELETLSLGDVSYLQVSGQTDVYRGRLVSIAGIVRRAHRIEAPSNSIGIESYYQCWLFAPKGPLQPIIVYMLDPPPDLPEGMEVEYPIELTGMVYKRWAFKSAEELTSAPVLLAKSVSTSSIAPQTASSPATPPLQPRLLLPIVAGVACLAGVAMYGLHRLNLRRSRSPAVELTPSQLSALAEFDSPDTSS